MNAAPPRVLPALDQDSHFYWKAGAEGRLLIQRCACGRYQHPPFPRCAACGSEAVAPVPVSGRGRVKTFTINYQPWRPGLAVPYVFAAVELAEQPGLYVFTSIIGLDPEATRIGIDVEVTFEEAGDVWLPMFLPVTAHG